MVDNSVRQSLNPRHRLFAEKFVIHLNVADAYLAAGYSAKTRKMAAANGWNLLKREDIQTYIQELQDRRSQRLEITADRVLQEVARVAFATIGDVTEWKDNKMKVKNSEDLSDDVMAAIAEVSETRAKGSVTVAVKMHQKTRALGQLMKHLGIDVDVNQLIARLRGFDYSIIDNQAQIDEGESEEGDE
jgi:phage terminase small subunit